MSRISSYLHKLSFSQQERHDLIKSWFVISLAVAIGIMGFSTSPMFLAVILASAVTVGIGFLLHELAHKAVAVHYGLWAEYRAFDTMLMISLALALFGILFAAPGAVFISRRNPEDWYIPIQQDGLISAAGPLTNYVLASMFLGVSYLFPFLAPLALVGAQANAWLGLFNMIPFLNFDGVKIWNWSIRWYVVMVVFGAGLMFLIERSGSLGALF